MSDSFYDFDSPTAWEFIVATDEEYNDDGLPSLLDGVQIHVVGRPGALCIMLELDDRTTHEHLREATPYALRWRDRLREWQGPLKGSGIAGLRNILVSLHGHRASYAELANAVNVIVAEWLNDHLRRQEQWERIRPPRKTGSKEPEIEELWEQLAWFVEHRGTKVDPEIPLMSAKRLLLSAGFKESDIDNWLNLGLDRLRQGLPAFEESYPVGPERMRSTIRQWKVKTEKPG